MAAARHPVPFCPVRPLLWAIAGLTQLGAGLPGSAPLGCVGPSVTWGEAGKAVIGQGVPARSCRDLGVPRVLGGKRVPKVRAGAEGAGAGPLTGQMGLGVLPGSTVAASG